MPVDFFTEAERERWQRFPDTVPQDDLFVFFQLSDKDKGEVRRQRDSQNRLGYALQLCILRYLGFIPDHLQAISPSRSCSSSSAARTMRMRVGCGRIQPRSGIRCWPALS